MLSHANLLHVAKRSGHLRGLSRASACSGALPISHVFGPCLVFLGTTLYGGTLYLVRASIRPAPQNSSGTTGSPCSRACRPCSRADRIRDAEDLPSRRRPCAMCPLAARRSISP
jgi:hypothetical protein